LRTNFRKLYYSIMEELKDKPYFVSFPKILCGHSVYLPDGVHLTAEGNKLVADRLGRVLSERSRKLLSIQWPPTPQVIRASVPTEIVEYLRNGDFYNGTAAWACSAEHYFVDKVGTKQTVFWAHHNGGNSRRLPVLYQDVWGVAEGRTVKLSTLSRNSESVDRVLTLHIWEGENGKCLGGNATTLRLTTDWRQGEVVYKKKRKDSKLRVEISWHDFSAAPVQIKDVSLTGGISYLEPIPATE
jgi:hypothetical protein